MVKFEAMRTTAHHEAEHWGRAADHAINQCNGLSLQDEGRQWPTVWSATYFGPSYDAR